MWAAFNRYGCIYPAVTPTMNAPSTIAPLKPCVKA